MKHFSQVIFSIFVVLLSANLSLASLIDHSFKPFVTKTRTTYVNAIVLQPDGKYLVGGQFASASGNVSNSIARFNPDGTFDTSFQHPRITGIVTCLFLQSDGKILVGGTNMRVFINNVSHWGVLRLNSDGSLDTTFLNGTGASGVQSVSAQPDGKVLIAGSFSQVNGIERWGVARLNTDGSLDTTFNANLAGGWGARVAVLPGGKIFVAGEFTSAGSVPVRFIVRLNPDGSLDTSFNLVFNGNITVIKVLPDNRILLGGSFSTISGTTRKALARLNADGTLDETLNFDSGFASNGVDALDLQPDGKIVIGGEFFHDLSTTSYNLYRLESDGTVNQRFSEVTDSIINAVAVQSTGEILAGGFREGYELLSRNLFYRLTPSGMIDPNFPASVGDFGWAGTLGTLPNGKIYIGGDFVEVNGKDRLNIARLNPDGKVDTSFAPTGTNGKVNDLAVQPDGKVIIAGDFGLVNGVSRRRIARLNYDGSLDTSFNVGAGADNIINEVVLQPDGKIIIGGVFNNYNNITRNHIARLNSDGTLDLTFDAGSPGPNNGVNEIVPLPDGKILIGGFFAQINNFTVGQIARLNPDGTRDVSFNAGGAGTTGPAHILRTVDAIVVRPDGKIVIGGTFFEYNGIPRSCLTLLNSDGSLDPNFSPVTQNILAMRQQPDGKILVGGSITSVNGIPQNKLARFNVDGSLDNTFDIGSGGDNNVLELAVQTNGNVIIAGSFRKFGEQSHLGLAKLGFAPSTTSAAPFDFDGDRKTDIGIYRPSIGEWWINQSSTLQTVAAQFGNSSDKPSPADYTGDGKTDIAFWRPSSGEWFILRSENGSFLSFPFGTSGDIPIVGDFDADGKADPTIFRPTTGEWFILKSTGGVMITTFGTNGDKPVPSDFDGDGKTDIAIFRPSDGSWWYVRSIDNQFRVFQFGLGTDKPVAGDYTGDRRADIAVWRPSSGEWFILRSEDNSYYSVPFGASGDLPTPGDYDGDGKFDTAVFRPSTGVWYIHRSTTGILIATFGTNGDRPIPNAFVP